MNERRNLVKIWIDFPELHPPSAASPSLGIRLRSLGPRQRARRFSAGCPHFLPPKNKKPIV